MAGDFNKPVVSSTYTNFPTEVRANDASNAKMNYESEADTNVPEGALQFNRTDRTFEQLESGVWVPKPLSSAALEPDAASRSCLVCQSQGVIVDGNTSIFEIALLGDFGISVLILPKAFKCTHISINLSDTLNSGTITATLYKNGSTTSKSVNITSGKNNHGSITAESFSAGDRISSALTGASVLVDTSTANVLVTLWGHFTA